MYMEVYCSVNCIKTFMLKVQLHSMPWCSDIVTVKFCCIKIRLKIFSTSRYWESALSKQIASELA